MKLPASFRIYLKGLLMGMADIIPGVSGGTMALITNIYERLIRAIKDIDFKFIFYFFKGDMAAARKNFRDIDFALLIPLGLGIITAFLSLAMVLGYLLDEYPAIVFAFFFGLILASAGIVFRYVERFDARHIVSITAGFLFVFTLVGIKELSGNHSHPVIFFAGAAAICAMILPGISGALILLILGQYEFMLDTLKDFLHNQGSAEMVVVVIFMSGAVLGLVLFSRLLDYMIREHRSITMSFLFGLMLGALRAPAEEIGGNTEFSETLKIAGVVLAAAAGILMIVLVQRKSNYCESTTGKEKKDRSEQQRTVRGTDSGAAAASIHTTALKILRETENYRGFVRAKIGVVNETDTIIADCKLKIIIDNKVLRFDRVEPSYSTLGGEIDLGNINPHEKKTIAAYLDPMVCTTTALDAVLTCRDIHGNIQTEKMRPKEVNVVCPIFFTEDTANTAKLENLVANVLQQQDSKFFNIPTGLSPRAAFEIARSSLSGRSVSFVRELSSPSPFMAEAWYYGLTKVKKMQMVIRVSVLEDTNSIEIFAAARSGEALTGLLAELGHDLSARLEQKGMPVTQITNVTIKDSIIHKSSLLFGDAIGTGTTNYHIADSIVHKSGSYPDRSISPGSASENEDDELMPVEKGSDQAMLKRNAADAKEDHNPSEIAETEENLDG